MSINDSRPSFIQVVAPRTGVVDFTGMCLRFAQSVFGAPAAHRSATDAANATKFRHHTRELPDVAALVWFDHHGTYQGEYANWGHVVAWVPGAGLLSSPPYAKYDANGNQIPWSQWYPSIDAVERAFSAKFRFWSEDINKLRVAEPVADLQKVLEDQMANPIINIAPRNALMIGRDDGTFEEYATPRAMNSRGIISVAFFGSDSGEKDLIPSLSEGDFQVVKTVWAQMCKGRAQSVGAGPGVSASEIAKAVNDDAAERLKD